MPSPSWFLGIVVLIGLLSGPAGAGSNANGEAITSKELIELENRALEGNSAAANRLVMGRRSDDAHDTHTPLFWMIIAAENGDPGDMYDLGIALSEDPDPQNRVRAIYWLRLAFAHGFSQAGYELCQIEAQNQADRKSCSMPEDAPPISSDAIGALQSH